MNSNNAVFRPSEGYLSYPFYKNNCSIYPQQGNSCPHMGTDYAMGRESDIFAVLGGVCIFSGIEKGDDYCGYGKMIVLEHLMPNGIEKFKTLYAHLDSRDVFVGDTVSAGDVIGGMGDTGYGSVHLHWGLILPTKPNERYVLTDGCGFADGYCVDGESFLLKYFGENPSHTGVVVEPTGMNLRSCPSTSCEKVGKLSVGANIVISELRDTEGYAWARLKNFDNMDIEWIAVNRGNYTYIKLSEVEPLPIEPPDPDLPEDCEIEFLRGYQSGYSDGLKDAISEIENLQKK